MHIMRWEEVCYKILDCESKLLQIKLPVSRFQWTAWVQFSRNIYLL